MNFLYDILKKTFRICTWSAMVKVDDGYYVRIRVASEQRLPRTRTRPGTSLRRPMKYGANDRTVE